jgi:O-antigen/teichoic acid export membrane protein
LKKIKGLALNTDSFTSNSFIYLLSSFLTSGIAFLTTPIFTRIMETSDYGIVSILTTWVSLLSIFITFQIAGSIATARIHKEPIEFEYFIRNILLLGLIGAVIQGLILLIIKNNIAGLMGMESSMIPHIVIQSYGSAIGTFFVTYLIQLKKPVMNLIYALSVSVLTIGISLVAVLSMTENRYWGKIWAQTIVYLIIIIFVFIYLFRTHRYRNETMFADWKYALFLGVPLIFHLISNVVLGQSDRIFIKKMIDDDAAGIYSVVYNIGTIGMIFAEACSKAWSPWYLDNTKAQKYSDVNRVALNYSLVTAFIFSSVMLLSVEVLKLMAPSQYWSAGSTVVIVLGAVFFQYLYRFPLGYEQYMKNMKWVAFATGFAAVLNLILNYYMIKVWGINGAAYATMVSYFILFIIHEFVARKIIKGYNIKFITYLPSIFLCGITFIISLSMINYLLVRIIALVFMIAAGFIYIYKVYYKPRKMTK